MYIETKAYKFEKAYKEITIIVEDKLKKEKFYTIDNLKELLVEKISEDKTGLLVNNDDISIKYIKATLNDNKEKYIISVDCFKITKKTIRKVKAKKDEK